MSRSWQREQWILDRRIEEFRELLTALAEAFAVAMKLHAEVVIESERLREFMNGHANALRVIRSRIFIVEEVAQFNIELRWAEAGARYQRTLDVPHFATVFNEMRIQIVGAARITQAYIHRPSYKRIFKHKDSTRAQ